MKIHHSIFTERSTADAVGRECGVEAVLDISADGFGTIDVTEDDPRWPCIVECLRRHGLSGEANIDRVWTEFTHEERIRAPFLAMMPGWQHGYPQPADVTGNPPDLELGYGKVVYDLSAACNKCWAGKKQVGPFRLAKPPVWGRRSVFQLNWVTDEFFVKPEVYESVFRPSGIGFWPVVLHKTGVELPSVLQLSIPGVVELDMGNAIPAGKCTECGREYYSMACRGFAPTPTNTDLAMFKSTQLFNGSERRIFVNNSLYRKIVSAKVKGAEFDPVAAER